jgi:hypothetical protein
MRRRQLLTCIAASALAPLSANALTIQTIPHPLRPANVPDGALSWDVLAGAGHERLAGGRLSRFPDAVQALDGAEVTLAGFMFPVSDGDTHSRFLLSGLAWHCGVCSLQDLTQLVDVTTVQPVAFTGTTLTLRGRLELVEAPEEKLFYRLHDARPV